MSPRSYGELLRAYRGASPGGGAADHYTIWLRSPEQAVWLRHGASDFDTFRQVLLRQQYGHAAGGAVATIMDAGANVGLTSVFLLRRYPGARAIAVEPDPENLEVAQRNLETFGDRAQVIHGAIWNEAGTLNVHRGSFRDGRHWASQVSDASDDSVGLVPAFTIEELVADQGWATLDLLKMDIEGAELQVFRDGPTEFLAGTRCCMVEVHDHPCYEALVGALRPHGFRLSQHSEVTLAKRSGPLQPADPARPGAGEPAIDAKPSSARDHGPAFVRGVPGGRRTVDAGGERR
ncbi:MAG: FkbM family methyltransferase [Planctomycetota bacterium]